MKFQTIFLVGIIIELCFVPLLDAKRSFGITRSRNKNNKPSVRRNQHGHEFDDNPVPVVHPKPEIKRPVSHSAPAGPPPAYPGMNHNSAAPYGAPPAYSPSYSNPPGYSSGVGYNQRFGQSLAGFQQPGHTQFGNQYSGAMPMGAMPMGVMPMNAMPMGGGGYGGYGRNGGYGSGIMTNLFAGLAGYQMAREFSGGHHHNRDREVIIIDNRQTNAENPLPPNSDQVAQPESHFINPTSTETSQALTQVGPAVNEYNHYGIPQYGIPLYGYSLPSQITDYYQTAIVQLPREIPQPAYEQAQQPISG